MDVTRLQRVPVDPRYRAALGLDVRVVFRSGRIGPGPETVAAGEVLPATVGDAAGIGAVARPGAVVLETAVDLVGILFVKADKLKLVKSASGHSFYLNTLKFGQTT